MPLSSPSTDPVPTGGFVPERAHGVTHLMSSSGDCCTPSLRKEDQNIPRQRLNDVLGQEGNYDYSAF